ncbi:protein of unknown function [Lentzea waywayandensis]|uniref:Galactose oxidase-like Early set domain-containing protein n=1 Tax=Lentzea waywayandensis TaxID=84724 RepID=A0A1I6EWZ6_9PSEU|nr:galactose oxidase early set domain-containing protein [Lentzea waywayandensis]SFR22148.1 protein of unknown function [Lentzea waywayandensis]
MPDKWEIVQDTHGHPLLADILMIHVSLLPSGKVLGIGGSQHDQNAPKPFHSVLWDPAAPQTMRVIPFPGPDPFCAGHCLLPDGNVLVAGGTDKYDRAPQNPHGPHHFTGIADCFIFEWRTEQWTQAARMANPRWYPTLITLSDGRVLCMSGHGGTSQLSHEVLETEIYDPTALRWKPPRATVPKLEDTGQFWLFTMQRPMIYYTRLHGLADGRIFSSTALQEVGGRRRTRILDVSNNMLTTVGPPPCGMLVPLMSHVYSRSNFTSVLLPLIPPKYEQHVLIAGGRTARRFDLETLMPRWRRAGQRRPYPMRAYTTGLLLADGSTLLIGGGRSEKVPRWYWPWSEVGGYDEDANFIPERYLWEQDTWVEGSAPTDYPPIPRMYHTCALVLPSGAVLVVGSNHDSQRNDGGSRTDHGHHGQDARELRMEIYSPPHLFDGVDANGKPHPAQRPEVGALPTDSAGYGDPITLTSPDAHRIQRVTVLRCSSVTHGYTSDQRLIELVIDPTSRTAQSLTVTTPPTPTLAIPGYYLLFALDGAGVPSVGQFLLIG